VSIPDVAPVRSSLIMFRRRVWLTLAAKESSFAPGSHADCSWGKAQVKHAVYHAPETRNEVYHLIAITD
jgi:hypothetical protein